MIILTAVKIKATASAHQNPAITNPGTIALTSQIIKALITKVNSPNVKIFAGSVRISNNGLMNKLTKLKTIAAQKAVRKLATWIPGRNFDKITKTKAKTAHLTKNMVTSI